MEIILPIISLQREITTIASHTVDDGENIKVQIRRGIPEADYWQETSEYRVLNIGQLQKHLGAITKHVALCTEAMKMSLQGKEPVRIMKEKLPHGLASVMRTGCLGCGTVMEWDTSLKHHMKDGDMYDVNLRAAWGEISTGGGMCPHSERFACMGIPSMSKGNCS